MKKIRKENKPPPTGAIGILAGYLIGVAILILLGIIGS